MSPIVACPICSASAVSWFASQTDRRKGLSGRWDYWVCSICEVIFLHPTPSVKDLIEYYAKYYPANDSSDQSAPGLGTRHSLLRQIFHALSGDVDPRDFIRFKRGSRILDYGSGGGAYMHFFQARGATISGIELSPLMVEQCRKSNLDVNLVANFDKLPYPDGEFDVIYLMQVLEHLHNPQVIMSELSRTLAKTGKIYIAVPNGRSVWARVFGSNWLSGWFAPFHLFLYSVKSLSVLANMHGLRITQTWSRTPESWFLLNLSARVHNTRGQIEVDRTGLGSHLVRFLAMLPLRAIDLITRENDCLVVELVKA